MSTDTQIKSYAIPAEMWLRGSPRRADLPPLSIPARDALDIERRSKKGVNLRNEAQRYTLCCERIQGVTADLASEEGLLPPPAVFVRAASNDNPAPTARGYLAVIEAVTLYWQKALGKSYSRIASVFFPPEDAARHSQLYEAISTVPNVGELFTKAAERASLPGAHFKVTPQQCRAAFELRRELLRSAMSAGSAVVDVIELI